MRLASVAVRVHLDNAPVLADGVRRLVVLLVVDLDDPPVFPDAVRGLVVPGPARTRPSGGSVVANLPCNGEGSLEERLALIELRSQETHLPEKRVTFRRSKLKLGI